MADDLNKAKVESAKEAVCGCKGRKYFSKEHNL